MPGDAEADPRPRPDLVTTWAVRFREYFEVKVNQPRIHINSTYSVCCFSADHWPGLCRVVSVTYLTVLFAALAKMVPL